MSMEASRAAAADVYHWVKAAVLKGEFLAGERLDPRGLAKKIGASPSTVHTVLGRLAAEHLLLSLPGEGFHMPFLTEDVLRSAYRWMYALSLTALDLAGDDPAHELQGPTPTSPLVDDDPDVLATERFFNSLAARTENHDVRIAMAQTNDRLHALRRLEKHVLPDRMAEIDAMCGLLGRNEHDALRDALACYRDRRLVHVPELVRLRHRVRQ